MKMKRYLWGVLFFLCFLMTSCATGPSDTLKHGSNYGKNSEYSEENTITKDNIPEYSGNPYVVLCNNQPSFKDKEITTKVFENYSELDALGRCGVAYANICKELMPTQERGKIGMIKPTGWHTVKYNCVDGKYLYNRCHLIGFQLAGENANEKNLITGTRYMNVDGMLPFEDEIADYVKKTNHHVLYRVTPLYKGNNLLANGVELEAYSVEDKGAGVCFPVYVYNCQPGVWIDYATGESKLDKNSSGATKQNPKENVASEKEIFILNKSTKKFHRKDCSSVKDMKGRNKTEYTGNRDEVISMGYEPCQRCKP